MLKLSAFAIHVIIFTITLDQAASNSVAIYLIGATANKGYVMAFINLLCDKQLTFCEWSHHMHLYK